MQEMNCFLDRAGLVPFKWFSGFQEVEEIDDTTWHIVCLARKA
jgi:hypothetical protein